MPLALSFSTMSLSLSMVALASSLSSSKRTERWPGPAGAGGMLTTPIPP